MNWLSTKHKLDACRKELKGKLGKLFAFSCFHSIYILGYLFCTNAVLTTVLSSLEPVNAPKEIPASIPAESATPLKVMIIYIVPMLKCPHQMCMKKRPKGNQLRQTEDEENPQHKK